ncbi:MAG: DUF1501 domain-containing protein [Planctomycetes bacterium]|nr:DUF1501 domain-containing protein [Planctomycetota bacterium]
MTQHPCDCRHDSGDTFRAARRDFLTRCAGGLGMIAAGSLLYPELSGAGDVASRGPAPLAGGGILGSTHLPAKAKRVIYLFQSGGPSQLDLFDYKPLLVKQNGKEVPKSILGTQRVTLMTRSQSSFASYGSPFKFAQHGNSGAWFSELLPNMAKTADEWCFVKSLQSEPINHDPAVTFMQSGRQVPGRPAFGSWLNYGLGSECTGIDHGARGEIIDTISQLNRLKHQQVQDPEIETRIDAFQMAYKMQTTVPQLLDFSDEPAHVLELYGPEVRQQGSYAYQCLLARRLAERGVRFVQLFHGGWDHHANIPGGMKRQAANTDRATAALIMDLKQHGLLDDTLVVWGGEFGRTAYTQSTQGANGRDHHPRCFTVALAGGGIKPGITHGATDDYGYNIASDMVHVRDLHATLLRCLGIDHQRFTFRFQGLDDKLTGVEPAKIVKEILV